MQPINRFADPYNPDVIITNISWNLSEPLTQAALRDEDDNILFNDQIRQELNNLYFHPLSRRININLWDRKAGNTRYYNLPWDKNFEFKDFEFISPDNKPLNYWQLLSGIDNYLRWGEQQYGSKFSAGQFFRELAIDRRPSYDATMNPRLALSTEHYDIYL